MSINFIYFWQQGWFKLTNSETCTWITQLFNYGHGDYWMLPQFSPANYSCPYLCHSEGCNLIDWFYKNTLGYLHQHGPKVYYIIIMHHHIMYLGQIANVIIFVTATREENIGQGYIHTLTGTRSFQIFGKSPTTISNVASFTQLKDNSPQIGAAMEDRPQTMVSSSHLKFATAIRKACSPEPVITAGCMLYTSWSIVQLGLVLQRSCSNLVHLPKSTIK